MRDEPNYVVEFAESVQPPVPREEKWVLIISSLFGCPVKCRMCDACGEYMGRPEAEELVPQADVVGITGTAFTNNTIESLLRLCRPDAYVVLLGGTAPLSPVLFDYGINAISGTLVTDPDIVLRSVSQGATFRQIKGTVKLTMTR